MSEQPIKHRPYFTIIALVIVAVYYLTHSDAPQAPPPSSAATAPGFLLDERAEGRIVQSSGIVERILPDDNDGSRHQRFILRLATGQTVLVAHNIDLAPRIDSLKAGDEVKFRGEYETNDRGGVIHWTHHDPRGDHPAGWLEHRGKRYQ